MTRGFALGLIALAAACVWAVVWGIRRAELRRTEHRPEDDEFEELMHD